MIGCLGPSGSGRQAGGLCNENVMAICLEYTCGVRMYTYIGYMRVISGIAPPILVLEVEAATDPEAVFHGLLLGSNLFLKMSVPVLKRRWGHQYGGSRS